MRFSGVVNIYTDRSVRSMGLFYFLPAGNPGVPRRGARIVSSRMMVTITRLHRVALIDGEPLDGSSGFEPELAAPGCLHFSHEAYLE
jgi:hypothetical protein